MSVTFSFTLPSNGVKVNTPTTSSLLGNSKQRSQKYISESIDNIYRTLGLFFKGPELAKLSTTREGKAYYDLYQEYVQVIPSGALQELTKRIFATLSLNLALKARAATVTINNGEFVITVNYEREGDVAAKSVKVETKTAFTVFKSSL